MSDRYIFIRRALATVVQVAREGGIKHIVLPHPKTGELAILKVNQPTARGYIEHYLTRVLYEERRRNRHEWFPVYAPYCLRRLEPRPGEPQLWLYLNRLYKPLGVATYWPWVDYEDYRADAIILEGDPFRLTGVWTATSPSDDSHWLYNDQSRSLRDYFTRLNRLEAAADSAWRASLALTELKPPCGAAASVMETENE